VLPYVSECASGDASPCLQGQVSAGAWQQSRVRLERAAPAAARRRPSCRQREGSPGIIDRNVPRIPGVKNRRRCATAARGLGGQRLSYSWRRPCCLVWVCGCSSRQPLSSLKMLSFPLRTPWKEYCLRPSGTSRVQQRRPRPA